MLAGLNALFQTGLPGWRRHACQTSEVTQPLFTSALSTFARLSSTL